MYDDRNEKAYDAERDAHRRFMRRRTNFIESNPNAVSPFENRSILGRRREIDDRADLFDHEMDMLRKKGDIELDVAKEKRLGMIGQGSEAAKAKAVADIGASENELEWRKYASDSQKEIEKGHDSSGLTMAEKKMLNDLEIEKSRGLTSKEVAMINANAQKETDLNKIKMQNDMLKFKIEANNATKQDVADKNNKGKVDAQIIKLLNDVNVPEETKKEIRRRLGLDGTMGNNGGAASTSRNSYTGKYN